MVGSSLAPKWPMLVPFCGMDHQKSKFSLILALFLSEAVEANWCHFFENWWMKLKCPLLLKPQATIFQENSQSFYPSEPFRISHFTMRHPVNSTSFFSSSILSIVFTWCIQKPKIFNAILSLHCCGSHLQFFSNQKWKMLWTKYHCLPNPNTKQLKCLQSR